MRTEIEKKREENTAALKTEIQNNGPAKKVFDMWLTLGVDEQEAFVLTAMMQSDAETFFDLSAPCKNCANVLN